MTFSASYWTGAEVEERRGRWRDLPARGLLWVRIEHGEYAHELIGADGYWIEGQRYGMTFEDAQPVYGGRLFAAFQCTGDGMMDLGETPPPPGAYVVLGEMLPDAAWSALRGAD